MSDQQVKLISEWYMRLEAEINESKRQYNLGSSDLRMLLLSYIQWVFIFKKPHNFSPSSFLDKLKLSVSQALVYFPPITGQLVTQSYKDEHSCSMYIDCRKGPGVKLIHAEAVDLSIDDVLSVNSDIPQVVGSFFDVGEMELINYDGHTKPLLSVQVTKLADGVVMGISINHCVADGTAFHHFLDIWSELFAASSTSPSIIMPIHDGNGPIIKLPYVDPNESIVRVHHSHTRERIFHFSPTTIALLKAKANTEASESNISSFQALSAFIWRCITRARNLCSNERTTCGLVANLRPRFDPPLPQEYFGNFLMAAKGTAEVGELLASSLGWAASLLHRAVASLNDKVSQEVCGGERVSQLLLPGLRSQGPNPVLVGGSPRFDVYGLKFGLGRAVAVHSGFQHNDGLVSAFPGAKGDGSVDLQVCLAPQIMSRLLSSKDFMSFASNSYFSQI